jgi:hypothetical protein
VNDQVPSVLHMPWSPGTHWGKTIVARAEDLAKRHEDDQLVGMALSAAVAAHICELHNDELERRGDG